MQGTEGQSAVNEAVAAAIRAGISPLDAARVAGVPLPEPYVDGDRASRTSDYDVRWMDEGEVMNRRGLREIWGQAGWYIRRLDGGPIHPRVRIAFRALVAQAARSQLPEQGTAEPI